jgi:hypothetical protein
MDDATLRTVWQNRQQPFQPQPVGRPLATFMRYTLGKRVKQLSKLASVWEEVIPRDVARHTALDKYQRGSLTVLVDSASHLFTLQTLLDGGLRAELQRRFNGPLNRVRLVQGQFYDTDEFGSCRYLF